MHKIATRIFTTMKTWDEVSFILQVFTKIMYECVSHKLRGFSWRRLETPWDGLILSFAEDALSQICVVHGTSWHRLFLCLAGDTLRQTCVVQGTPWDTLVLCLARDVLGQTYSVLQRTTWDRLILCLARIALRQNYSVSCRGWLEMDLFCLAGDVSYLQRLIQLN